MARVVFLQPYNNHVPGEVAEIPGGIASVLLLRRIAMFDMPAGQSAPDQTRVITCDVPGPVDPRRSRRSRK